MGIQTKSSPPGLAFPWFSSMWKPENQNQSRVAASGCHLNGCPDPQPFLLPEFSLPKPLLGSQGHQKKGG